MRIDRSRIKESTSEVPEECQSLIDRLRSCSHNKFGEQLKKIKRWTFGKCCLYHWIDILDLCDAILEKAATRVSPKSWQLFIDVPQNEEIKELLQLVLSFTALLIENSLSNNNIYNSFDHLITLLSACDLQVVTSVLNIFHTLTKRSNFIAQLAPDIRNSLFRCLTYLAESWGGKENGFGLADCSKLYYCLISATTLHFEFYADEAAQDTNQISCIHLEKVDKINKTLAEIMDGLVEAFKVPKSTQMMLFTNLRLAYSFSVYELRLKCVEARLQALSVLFYSKTYRHSHLIFYPGILDELVELLELSDPALVDIRSAALQTLTSVIHLEQSPHLLKTPGSQLNNIIDVTGIGKYHGFLPQLVRNCINSLTSDTKDTQEEFPLPLATALFNFLCHLASYEAGGAALVSCGMMDYLLRVVSWPGTELQHITFVTRAVDVISHVTDIDMQVLQNHGGLANFIKRIEMEIALSRKIQPFEILVDAEGISSSSGPSCSQETCLDYSGDTSVKVNKTCLPHRAALLKSILNLLKKALQDPAFSDSIHCVMDASLPSSLKHIISNAEYYGPSLFLLATDIVAVYVFQEPSLLSSLQNNGLTDVILRAILLKNVPATREVLVSLPNVFSALCLNTQGLESFVKFCPFDRLFKVLLSPTYLCAMRCRCSSELIDYTAYKLGIAVHELIENQPSLKVDAISAIIRLLEELCRLGRNSKYTCWRPQKGSKNGESPHQTPWSGNEAGSNDDKEGGEDEASTLFHPQREDTLVDYHEEMPEALEDYILNVMTFIRAVLRSDYSTRNCHEFVNQEGLTLLLAVLDLPYLPIDCPITPAVLSVAFVCKSILDLTYQPKVLGEGFTRVTNVLSQLKPLQKSLSHQNGSLLLRELASATCKDTAFSTPLATPMLNAMAAAYRYVTMFIIICQPEVDEVIGLSAVLDQWGTTTGLSVLKSLKELYTALVWESTILLALCSESTTSYFNREDIEKLVSTDKILVEMAVTCETSTGMTAAMEQLLNTNLSLEPAEPMEIDTLLPGSTSSSAKSNLGVTSAIKLKYIKPLLHASTRLGRALAELFRLMVQMCVGFSVSCRRNHLRIIPISCTPEAQAVASEIAALLAHGLKFDKLPFSPIPTFRKSYPYHLMLQKFVLMKGQKAFFDSFIWALSGGGSFDPDKGLEHPSLGEGTGKFLDAWLLLLEKMVNPKTLLESPHVLLSESATYHKVPTFDAIKYLQQVNELAFNAIDYLWGRKPLKIYGERMTDTLLLIYQHIFSSQNLCNKLEKSKNESGGITHCYCGVDELNRFARGSLNICLKLLEALPGTVYRVCDLLTTIMCRNDENFKYNIMSDLANVLIDNLSFMTRILEESKLTDEDVVAGLTTSVQAQRVAAIIHLYILLFEEIRIPCAKVVHSSGLLPMLIQLLIQGTGFLELNPNIGTPKWLAPLLLLIDLLEKVSVITNLKANMHRTNENSGTQCPEMMSPDKMREDDDSPLSSSPILVTDAETLQATPPISNGNSMEYEPGTDLCHLRTGLQGIPGVGSKNASLIVRTCVRLMKIPVNSDTLHAVLQVCVRFTCDYDNAKIAAELGVIKILLNLMSTTVFSGFLGLATILIRHVLEERGTLYSAIKKVILSKTLMNIPPIYKELHYILRDCSAAICRDPETFKVAAKDILRIDVSVLNNISDEEDTRLLMKSVPIPTCGASVQQDQLRETVAESMIFDLLYRLIEPDEEDINIHELPETESSMFMEMESPLINSAASRRMHDTNPFNPDDVTIEELNHETSTPFDPSALSVYLALTRPPNTLPTPASSSSLPKSGTNEGTLKMSVKAAVLKILADTVCCYSKVAKIVTEFRYKATEPSLIKKDCSPITFVLDYLLLLQERALTDLDVASMARRFIAALASCNHYPDAQAVLLAEVTAALGRTLARPESERKHYHIQNIVGIVTIMIESCPHLSLTNSPLNSDVKLHQYSANNMVQLMIQKGIANDLARIPYSLDLSSPKLTSTVNAVLKPLETLTRIMSQPSDVQPGKLKTKQQTPAPSSDELRSIYRIPSQHPLFVTRQNLDATTRFSLQHLNQTHRNQYEQMNHTSAAAPVFPQRIMEQSDQGFSSNDNTNNSDTDNSDTDNSDTEEEQINFVDQAGYLQSPSLAEILNDEVMSMHWWNEEGWLLYGESQADCAVVMGQELIPIFEKYRSEECMNHTEKHRKHGDNECSKKTDAVDAAKEALCNNGQTSGTSYAIRSLPTASDPRDWAREFGPRHHGSECSSINIIPVSEQSDSSENPPALIKSRGSHILDYISICCLLVLIFIEDAKINTVQLHTVFRNLCYHAPTRDWIVKALLSIMEESNVTQIVSKVKEICRPCGGKQMTTRDQVQPDSISFLGNQAQKPPQEAWLNICTDAALGCSARVFTVHRIGQQTEKFITIHPQATPFVYRHTLDLLISLAETFPICFSPTKSPAVTPGTLPKLCLRSRHDMSNFWDILIYLNILSTKKRKVTANIISQGAINEVSSLEASTFGQLLTMLDSPVICRGPALMDTLLQLLSVIFVSLQVNKQPIQYQLEITNDTYKPLSSAVNVLTLSNCSEEGFEEVAALLLTLSVNLPSTQDLILCLLLECAQKMASVVCGHIKHLLRELGELNNNHNQNNEIEASTLGSIDTPLKGVLHNRFTKDIVVVTAPKKVKTVLDLQLSSMAPLKHKNSSQCIFLRTIKVIVQIQDSLKLGDKNYNKEDYDDEKQSQQLPRVQHEMQPLSEQLNVGELWDTLSDCLTELAHTQDSHAVLMLQPTVEAFFLVHAAGIENPSRENNYTIQHTAQAGPSTSNGSCQSVSEEFRSPASPPVSPLPNEPIPDSIAAALPNMSHSPVGHDQNMSPHYQNFLKFAEKHRTVLNQILRQYTIPLREGPFALLINHPQVLDFDVKRRYFRSELERADKGNSNNDSDMLLQVRVRRTHLFRDSYKKLHKLTPNDWKKRFFIMFKGEEGRDMGGVCREWYLTLCREIFNPNYALFTISPGDRVTYTINPSSHCNSNHLFYFKFVGRVIAKAIYDNKLLECYLTRSFYKHILGIRVKYTDMESEDYSFYQGLKFLMDNDVKSLGSELTFSIEVQELGVTEIKDLIPNGRNILVNNYNKKKYVRLVCQLKMTGTIQQQLNTFLEGFYDIIPKHLISIFNEQELELLISGLPYVDIDDLKANTEYHNYQPNSLQIQWFWHALREFDQAERANFLQFVTGTCRVPLQGFAALDGVNGVQKFQICKDERSTDRLPSAHTCFNRLYLPVYETYMKLQTFLLMAIHECSEGFGFV